MILLWLKINPQAFLTQFHTLLNDSRVIKIYTTMGVKRLRGDTVVDEIVQQIFRRWKSDREAIINLAEKRKV